MTHSDTSRQRTLYLTKLSILAAILLFLQVTNLGYLRLGVISMTIMQVPVIIGAIVLGPAAGAVLGAVFGMTSLWQAVSGQDPLGFALFGLNPLGLILTTVPTRILMGGVTGMLYKALNRWVKPLNTRLVISSLLGAVTNTLLFMTSFVFFFFYSQPVQQLAAALHAQSPLRFAVQAVGVQGLIEAVICALLGSAIARALIKFQK